MKTIRAENKSKKLKSSFTSTNIFSAISVMSNIVACGYLCMKSLHCANVERSTETLVIIVYSCWLIWYNLSNPKSSINASPTFGSIVGFVTHSVNGSKAFFAKPSFSNKSGSCWAISFLSFQNAHHFSWALNRSFWEIR